MTSLIGGGSIIVQAPPGSGHVRAFSIGLLQRCDLGRRELQSVVLSPTRELAHQVHTVVNSIADGMTAGHSSICVTLTRPVGQEVTAGAIVVAGTPGRITEATERGMLRLQELKVVVLDEADETLARGFSDHLDDLIKLLPRDVPVALFSATMPAEVLEVANKIMRNPTRIIGQREPPSLHGIDQFYVDVEEGHKLKILTELLMSLRGQCIVFANTRPAIDEIVSGLTANGFAVCHVHGGMDQAERDEAVASFRTGKSLVLVATDLIARGLDLGNAHIVLNYDLPSNLETYLQRIGRRGKFGHRRLVINLAPPHDRELLENLEVACDVRFEKLPDDIASRL